MKDPTARVKYQPSSAEAASKRAQYSEGWMAAAVTQCKPTQSKEKPDLEVSPRYLALNFQFKPLRDPDDENSTAGRGIYRWQGLPIPVAHWEDCFANADDYSEEQQEEFQKWQRLINGFFARGTHEVLSALAPDDVHPMPRFEDGKIVQGDEVIGQADNPEANDIFEHAKFIALKDAGEKGEALYYGDEDPDELVGQVCYIYVKYKDGEREPQVERVRATHPEENGRLVDLVTGPEVLAGLRVVED